jgi:hypothetical protein
MEIGTTIFILAVLIIAIWVIVEIKRMKHKIFALFLIAVILFMYFSISSVFKGKDVHLGDMAGIEDAANIYFSWLGSVFGNVRTITANVIGAAEKGNSTAAG